MSTDMSTDPTPVTEKIDFATEVKADRLSILWKVSAVLALMILLGVIVLFTELDRLDIITWGVAPLILLLSSGLTHVALRRSAFDVAAICYSLGGVLTVSVALLGGHKLTYQIAPFFFVIVIFIAGLLVKPGWTFSFALLASVMTILLPLMQSGSFGFLGVYQVFAILLIFGGAGLAAQVTGELYAVTEWALMNYQRERNTNLDLFESKQELRKEFDRSQALSIKLQDTNAELDEARKAAETATEFRGKFLANMSHELRTPLNAIIGFSETMLKFPMLYDNEPLPDKYRADMNQIYDSGRQLLHLINDILDLARVDAGKLEMYMQEVDPTDIIDAALTTARGLIGNKPIELKAELPDPMPKVWADELRLRQVLLNLYSNAAKFTDEGTIMLRVYVENDEVAFSLTDTGRGIKAENLDTIFEEFRQGSTLGKDPRAGSGLGLAITRQLLQLMNGRIWAESVPGVGSTFTFTLAPYHKAKQTTMITSAISPAKLDEAAAAEARATKENSTIPLTQPANDDKAPTKPTLPGTKPLNSDKVPTKPTTPATIKRSQEDARQVNHELERIPLEANPEADPDEETLRISRPDGKQL